MAEEQIPLLMLGTLFVLLLFGYPVGFTLGGVALGFGYFFLDPIFLKLLPQRIWGIMTNFIQVVVLGLLIAFPGIVTWLPE